MKDCRLKVGDLVQHFKRETLDAESWERNVYVYKILMFAEHTETHESLVIYQAMYQDKDMGVNFGVYARPLEMFMSEVDKNKYPYIKQKYRFEKFIEEDYQDEDLY